VLSKTVEEGGRLDMVNIMALLAQVGDIVSHRAEEQNKLLVLVGQAP
jgi:hypothetical protein